MYSGTRQKQTNLYTTEQIKRVITNSGLNIENEVDSDYIVFCPYHANYRTPAGEVDKITGNFFCFSCHETRNLTEFVMHTTKRTFFEAQRFIDRFRVESNIIDSIDKVLEVKPEFVPFDEFTIRRLHNTAIDSPRAMRYFEGRRILENSVKRFLLGYSDKQDMVTIPMHTPKGDMCVGFVARSVEGKDFKNTPKLPKSKILFNLHRVKAHDTVYVVESSFDAIRLDQAGVPAVATLGSNVPKSQIELLTKHFNNVIVIPDNDDAGQEMANRIIDKVGPRATAIGLPSRFKDIGDMTDADIKELTNKINDPLLAMY